MDYVNPNGREIYWSPFFCVVILLPLESFRIRVFLVFSFDTYHMMFIDIILVETVDHKICIDLKVVSRVFDVTNHFICM